MRSLHKSWQDKRPGWTRRVRWYEPDHEWEDVRLEFTDEAARLNCFYPTAAAAQAAYDRFRNGESALSLFHEHPDPDHPDGVYKQEGYVGE